MAALIAFDKYRHNSAEAGAKYILTALFSSALLLFGLSMILWFCWDSYFDDLPAHFHGKLLQIMAFILLHSEWHSLSLVPFHLWKLTKVAFEYSYRLFECYIKRTYISGWSSLSKYSPND